MTTNTYCLKLTTGSRTVIENFQILGEEVRIFSRGLSKAVCLPAVFVTKQEARVIYREMIGNGWTKI